MKRNFFELKGQILNSITVSDEQVNIITNKGKYFIHHIQDCCGSVCVDSHSGNAEDLFGHEITLAEEDSEDSWQENGTVTQYVLEAGGHRFEVKWLGQSNGYYSEATDFYKED
jgi:hypothetical protein